jgi:ATP/maltotriose-dependent transcriptional regulator MalT
VRLRTGAPTAPAELTRAVERTEPGLERLELALRAGRALGRASQADAVRVCRLGLDGAPEDGGEDRLRVVAELIMNASLFAEHRPLAWELLDSEQSAAKAGSGAEALLQIARAWRMTLDGERAEEVRELTDRALRGGALATEADSLLVSLSAAVLVLNEGLEFASQLCDAGIEQARARGWPSPLAFAQWLRANIEYRRGNLGPAGADAAAALAFTNEHSAEVAQPWVVAVFSDVHVAQGRLSEAEEAHARSKLDVEIPEFTRALVLESRGRLRLAQNRSAEALADLRGAGAEWDSIGMANLGIARWRSEATRALLRLDQADEARDLAARQLEIARGTGGSWALGLSLRTAAAAERGEQRLALLDEAIETLEGSEARLEYAQAQVERGEALLDGGDREGAREPLNGALALARSCGATPLAERAYELLEASGARPRKLIRGGLESLTPSELRVARMAADGLANKEIAQTLFVTVRTVETHLRHTYQKLDISSRDELAGSLRPRDAEDSLAAAG